MIKRQQSLEVTVRIEEVAQLAHKTGDQASFFKHEELGIACPTRDASPLQDTHLETTRSIITTGSDVSQSQDTQYEVTTSITTPPEWDVSLFAGYPA